MRWLLFILLLVSFSASAQLKADFSVSGTKGCSPLSIQFTDKSTGSPTQWFWDFGNGITSGLQNPTAVYTTGGTYSVRLIIKNANTQDYIEKNNYINVYTTPEANFVVNSIDSGCVPLQVFFKDSSLLFNTSIKNWQWNFGDAGTSTQQNPSHVYTVEGEYNVSLTITTVQSCVSIYTINRAVVAGTKPVPAFSASPHNGCASTLRNFKNKTPGNVSASLWDFGDGSISYELNPQHHYLDTGYFNVKLSVSNNGCVDSTDSVKYIHVDGAVAKFNEIIDCANRYSIIFRDLSIAETSNLWDFGDGQTATGKALQHTYSAPGIYYVKLIVNGSPCNDIAYDTLHIETGAPKINVSPQKNIYCRNDSLLLYATGFDSVITKAFSWNFGDGYIKTFGKKSDSTYYVYKTNGSFKPEVYIKDNEGCIDTFSLGKAINVNGPFAGFMNTASGCANTPINFQDQSVPGQNAAITQWGWRYNDGITANTKGPLNHSYVFPGTYNPNLKVTDVNGCTDSIAHTVDVFAVPVVKASANVSSTCAGIAIPLKTTGADTYVWQTNADLSCINCADPVATPFQSAVYYVTGTSNGCSASDSVSIKIQSKETVTAQTSNYVICEGGSTGVSVSGADHYTWSPPSTITNPFISNPIAFPSTTTTYTVAGTDSNNCFNDTAFVTVTVNPKPVINIIDSAVQLPKGSTYNIVVTASNDAQSFSWSPPTGLSCYNCLQPMVTFNNAVTYTLVATTESGCSDTDNIVITPVCTESSVYIPNTFSPNNDGINDYFYPRSNSGVIIRSLTIFNRWGEAVYQKTNFPTNSSINGWDGRYKNVPQKADVYTYIIELMCYSKKFSFRRGSITLIR